MTPKLNLPATGVIVTGGASGIGLASAQARAAVGRPVALWDIAADRARDAAAALAQEFGVKAIGLGVDIRDLDSYDAAIAESRAAMGSIGGFVHAAGVVDTASIDGMTADSWDAGINTHLRPLAFLAQKLQPDLAANQGSAIVAITSINATLGNAINPIYTAAKGGMLSLVRSLADRLARDGVRVNSVSPAQILTPMMKPAVDNLPGFFEKRILLARIGEPEEIGSVVRFLMSDDASYITAAELLVDGGNISSQRV